MRSDNLFGPERYETFWMSTVKFPIDIIFIRQDGRIGKIIHDVQPGDPGRWSYSRTACVVEVVGGFCKAHGIGLGDEIGFGHAVRAQRYPWIQCTKCGEGHPDPSVWEEAAALDPPFDDFDCDCSYSGCRDAQGNTLLEQDQCVCCACQFAKTRGASRIAFKALVCPACNSNRSIRPRLYQEGSGEHQENDNVECVACGRTGSYSDWNTDTTPYAKDPSKIARRAQAQAECDWCEHPAHDDICGVGGCQCQPCDYCGRPTGGGGYPENVCSSCEEREEGWGIRPPGSGTVYGSFQVKAQTSPLYQTLEQQDPVIFSWEVAGLTSGEPDTILGYYRTKPVADKAVNDWESRGQFPGMRYVVRKRGRHPADTIGRLADSLVAQLKIEDVPSAAPEEKQKKPKKFKWPQQTAELESAYCAGCGLEIEEGGFRNNLGECAVCDEYRRDAGKKVGQDWQIDPPPMPDQPSMPESCAACAAVLGAEDPVVYSEQVGGNVCARCLAQYPSLGEGMVEVEGVGQDASPSFDPLRTITEASGDGGT